MKLKYAELHKALFLGGINLGEKLDVSRRAGLRLEYDRKEKELQVIVNGNTGIVPVANIASMVEDDGAPAVKPISNPPTPSGKIKAQVQVPAGLKLE